MRLGAARTRMWEGGARSLLFVWSGFKPPPAQLWPTQFIPTEKTPAMLMLFASCVNSLVGIGKRADRVPAKPELWPTILLRSRT
jgi:hypothetical protein